MTRITTLIALAAGSAAIAGPIDAGNIDRSSYQIFSAQAAEIGEPTFGTRGSPIQYSDMLTGPGGYVAFPATPVTVNGQLEVVGTADFTSISAGNITLDSFRFVGGVNQAGGVAFFDFFDSLGNFVDGFGVQFASSGNFIYNIDITTPFDIAGAGFVQMLVDDENLAGAGSTAGAQWFLGNNGATIGDSGAFEANPDFNFNFELIGVPAPGALAALGVAGLAAARRRR